MQQLARSAEQTDSFHEVVEQSAEQSAGPDVEEPTILADLMNRPLTEAKRLAAAAFERRYLVQVMERAGGSVSGGARLSGLDRTNFRRLLQRHGLHGTACTHTVSLEPEL